MVTTKYFGKLLVCCGIILCLLVLSCDKDSENPNTPSVYINIEINPNSTVYQELNTVSGWMYLTATTPSRGIIVYRYSTNEFIAYERTPPNEPDNCCDDNGNCSRLVVDFPFVVDECNNISYNILNGGIIEGSGRYPLIQYRTAYNGNILRIYN